MGRRATAGDGSGPRFSRAWWRRWRGAALLGLLSVLGWQRLGGAMRDHAPAEGAHRVERVVGDTLELSSGAVVRLQGVRPIGSGADARVGQFVEQSGRWVRLTFGAERVDRQGRWLAFVWSGDRMLNEELVLAGLAEARLDHRHAGRMKRRLQRAEQASRSAGRGVWSAPPGRVSLATHEPAS